MCGSRPWPHHGGSLTLRRTPRRVPPAGGASTGHGTWRGLTGGRLRPRRRSGGAIVPRSKKPSRRGKQLGYLKILRMPLAQTPPSLHPFGGGQVGHAADLANLPLGEQFGGEAAVVRG